MYSRVHDCFQIAWKELVCMLTSLISLAFVKRQREGEEEASYIARNNFWILLKNSHCTKVLLRISTHWLNLIAPIRWTFIFGSDNDLYFYVGYARKTIFIFDRTHMIRDKISGKKPNLLFPLPGYFEFIVLYDIKNCRDEKIGPYASTERPD